MVLKNENQLFKSMQEVMDANKASGMYFFNAGNMEFFKSEIETDLISSRWFITSELSRKGFGHPREFTVREVLDNTGKIKTVDRGFKTLDDAKRAMLKL